MTANPGWNALLLSVGAYRHHPALSSPAAGARRLQEVLADPEICGFADVDRLDNPTAEQARRAVTDLVARNSDNAMLIFFSGHGRYDFAAGRLHLLTVDSAPHPEDGGDSLTDLWLMSELATVRDDRVLVVLDTCFRGAALSPALSPLPQAPYAIAFRSLTQGHGYHMLAAASPVERQSSLTRALVEVLCDGSAADDSGWAPVGRVCELAAGRCGHTTVSSAQQRGSDWYLARRPPDPPEPPDLATVRQALANRDYPAVRRLLRQVKDGNDAEYRYYAVLGMFGGHRPREFATDDIRRAEGHLAHASSHPPQLCAVWALIKEDHYVQRGIEQGQPTVEDLIQRAREIDPAHAAEIVAHLPAPECQTWVRLRNRARQPAQQMSR